MLVGAGSIGREFALRHLVAANGAAVCAIVDPNRAAREALAADVAAAKVVDSAAETALARLPTRRILFLL